MVCVAFIRTTKGNVRNVFMVMLLFGVAVKKRLPGVWHVMYNKYINTEVPHRDILSPV